MTPQTLLNDLKNKLFDSKKISLIVFDEAHRATGDYAYTIIVKILK
jgi:ATP-dependent DNA helicase MPH1